MESRQGGMNANGLVMFLLEGVLGAVSEPCMRVVYRKLMEKAADFS